MRAPEFWRRGGLAPVLLAPLAWGYDALGHARRAMARPRRFGFPVICVGNLVAGGAGKTPVALSIGRRLAERGSAVHFLTRGHGGLARGPLRVDLARHDARHVGDEALLLAAVAPTWVARNRPRGALAAVEAGAEAVVMDDGFQNPTLAKDLSLVVIDGDYGFGNGWVMPAGPLREGVAAGLRRAQAVVVLGGERAAWDGTLAGFGLPVLHGTVEPTPDCAALAGRPVLAFAGLARPEKLFATLEAMGCRIVGALAFPDHHRYDPDEIMSLVEEASAKGAVPVTSEKDHVRLPAEARPMVEVLRVAVAWADEAALDTLLDPLLARYG